MESLTAASNSASVPEDAAFSQKTFISGPPNLPFHPGEDRVEGFGRRNAPPLYLHVPSSESSSCLSSTNSLRRL
jgi:hypothetical protein